MNEYALLPEKGTVIASWNRHGLVDVILVLWDSVRHTRVERPGTARTFGFTSSMTACFKFSRFMAFFAGVRAITLSSLSLYPPMAANSSALENLTYTPYFFMIRWILRPPTPMIRL